MTMYNSITTESGEATFRRNGTLKISTGLTRLTGFQETENACPNRKECSIENPFNPANPFETHLRTNSARFLQKTQSRNEFQAQISGCGRVSVSGSMTGLYFVCLETPP